MSFSIQTSKGFMPVNCDDCGSYFWMNAGKAQAMTASGKKVCCRDCQIFKGYEVPPWPCARKLDDHEVTELEVETQRNALSYAQVKPPEPEPLPVSATENRMTLAELRDRLKYYLDVSNTSQAAFARSSGLPQPTVSTFCRGSGLTNTNRFKLVAEMEKRNWLVQPVEQAEQKPPEPVKAEETKPPFVPPYPDAPTHPPDETPSGQDFNKYLANLCSLVLHEQPDHPNRAKIEEQIAEHKRIADMTPEQFQDHRRWDANPVNKLTHDEKVQCIKMLPAHIVNKLFPHI